MNYVDRSKIVLKTRHLILKFTFFLGGGPKLSRIQRLEAQENLKST
jgi:hypothetical protein